MGNVKNKKKLNIPYSSEYLAEELKLHFKPLLEKKDVAEKWSFAIQDFSNISASELSIDNKYVEQNLLTKVSKKSYTKAFYRIQEYIEQLIGQLILRRDINYIEINELMLQINKNLDYIYNLNCSVDSWLCEENNFYNSHEYDALSKIIFITKSRFSELYSNLPNIEFEKINLKNINSCNLKTLEKLNLYYEKILDLGKDILISNEDNRLYECKNIINNLLYKLFYLAGNNYLYVEACTNVLAEIENEIDKNFKGLKNNIFCKSLYCDLKAIINA